MMLVNAINEIRQREPRFAGQIEHRPNGLLHLAPPRAGKETWGNIGLLLFEPANQSDMEYRWLGLSGQARRLDVSVLVNDYSKIEKVISNRDGGIQLPPSVERRFSFKGSHSVPPKYPALDSSRHRDTEYALVNCLAYALGTASAIKGKVQIFTELVPCESCTDVICRFMAAFSSLSVEVAYINDTRRVEPDEHGLEETIDRDPAEFHRQLEEKNLAAKLTKLTPAANNVLRVQFAGAQRMGIHPDFRNNISPEDQVTHSYILPSDFQRKHPAKSS